MPTGPWLFLPAMRTIFFLGDGAVGGPRQRDLVRATHTLQPRRRECAGGRCHSGKVAVTRNVVRLDVVVVQRPGRQPMQDFRLGRPGEHVAHDVTVPGAHASRVQRQPIAFLHHCQFLLRTEQFLYALCHVTQPRSQ